MPDIAPIIGWGFIGGGIAFFVLLVGSCRHWSRTRDWQTTRGTVERVVVRKETDLDRDADSNMFRLPVEYSYTVGTENYVGTRIAHGLTLWPSQSIAQRAATKYAVGQQVEVFYNPANPEDALLDISFPVFTATLLLALPTLMVIAGLFFLIAEVGAE